jgi:Mu transposase, C-terminal domain
MPFTVVLTLDRRITRDGMVSVGGNLYSVPDSTRRRVVEVHTLASEIRILEDDTLIAVHPVLEGSGRRRIALGHRTAPPPGNSMTAREMPPPPTAPGAIVVPRSLAFYDAVARRLAGEGGRP